MKLYYPAIFIPYEKSYTVIFPDLPGCITQGDSLDEAFEMAEDAACGWILTSIEDDEDIPSPSEIKAIKNDEGFVNYVTLDIGEYAKQYSTKAVKKTLTIPEWLNTLAERRGINFSQELQNALKDRLGLTAYETPERDVTLQESPSTFEQLISPTATTFDRSTNSITTSSNSSNIILIDFPMPYSQFALQN